MLIVMIVTYHYRYFWVPVNKRYIFEKSFLNDNEYLGPISVDALNSAINKKLFCYRYKWEKEVGYIVSFKDYNKYQSLKDDYLDIHANFEPIETYIKHEYSEGEEGITPKELLKDSGFSEDFIDSFGDIDNYHTLYSYISIRKQLYVDDDEFREYVFFNDSEESFIHIIRHYQPSDR